MSSVPGCRFGRAIVPAVVLTGLLLSTLSVQAAAAVVPATEWRPVDSILAGAARFRADFGLRHGAPLVEQSFRDPSFSSREYGWPLTPTESQLVQQRIESQARLMSALHDGENQPGFVEGYFNGDQLVLTTSADPSTLATVQQMAQGLVEVRRVQYSRAEIDGIIDEILDTRQEFGDFAFQAVSYDPIRARVVVEVSGDISRANEAYKRTFGSIIEVTESEPVQPFCSNINDCDTKGGLTARQLISGTTYQRCTTGFVAKTGGTRKMLGSGHCIAVASTNSWTNGVGSVIWGAEYGHSFANNSYADAGLFNISSPPNPSNLYFAGSPSDIRSISRSLANAEHPVGRNMCRSGYGSLVNFAPVFACGMVSSSSINFQATPTVLLLDQVRVNLKSYEGDSGAGFIHTDGNGTYAGGILVGGNVVSGVDRTYYSKIGRAMTATGSAVCVTPSC